MLDPAEQPGTIPDRRTAESPEAIETLLNDLRSDVTSSAPLGDSSPLLKVRGAHVAPSPGAATNNSINVDDVPSDSSDDPAPLWLRRTDQLVVGTLLVVLLASLTAHWLMLSRWGTTSIELTSLQPREYFYSLDINHASWVEWAQLDGIGEKLAKRIVADREEHGPFRDANDVGRVRGIYAKQLDSMRPFLRGGTANEATDP